MSNLIDLPIYELENQLERIEKEVKNLRSKANNLQCDIEMKYEYLEKLRIIINQKEEQMLKDYEDLEDYDDDFFSQDDE